MSDLHMQIQMAQVTCYHCGIEFALSATLFRQWVKVGHRICCPNGHPGILGTAKDDGPDAKTVERRRELVRQIHDQEQAEASAADGKNADPAVDRIIEDVARGAEAMLRHKCPYCDRDFMRPAGLNIHLAKMHRAGKGSMKTTPYLEQWQRLCREMMFPDFELDAETFAEVLSAFTEACAPATDPSPGLIALMTVLERQMMRTETGESDMEMDAREFDPTNDGPDQFCFSLEAGTARGVREWPPREDDIDAVGREVL